MPLIPALLQEPCLKLFTKGASDPLDAATTMSDAYESYTRAALFGAIPPAFTGLEKQKMKAVILAALPPGTMNPATLANAWSTGMTAWWLLPPIVVGPGAVTAIPGAMIALSALTSVFSIPGQTAETAAATLASIIDAATRTTIATVLGSPVPIV